jgi:hypothetical protein
VGAAAWGYLHAERVITVLTACSQVRGEGFWQKAQQDVQQRSWRVGGIPILYTDSLGLDDSGLDSICTNWNATKWKRMRRPESKSRSSRSSVWGLTEMDLDISKTYAGGTSRTNHFTQCD